ncbi:MAG: hypothetical protein ABFC92_08135 [Rectinema sp.]
MNIALRILHLHRALHYVPIEKPAHFDETALAKLASQFGECLLVFQKSAFFAMTGDGPRLSGNPEPDAAYRIAAQETPSPAGMGGQNSAGGAPFGFLLAAGDYVFFQWHAWHETEKSARPSYAAMLEEVVREIWWQRLECEGPWFLRLVFEDDKVAVQALRALKKAP